VKTVHCFFKIPRKGTTFKSVWELGEEIDVKVCADYPHGIRERRIFGRGSKLGREVLRSIGFSKPEPDKLQNVKAWWSLTGGGRLRKLRQYWVKILPH